MLRVSADLYGWAATKKLMRELEPEVLKQLDKEIYGLLNPVKERARSHVPASPPLSNWGRSVHAPYSRASYSPWGKSWEYTRLAWDASRAKAQISVRAGGQRKRGQATRAAYSLRSNNPAAAVFETMGRGKSRVPMIGNVRMRYGSSSPGRILWRAWEELDGPKIRNKVRDTLQKTEKDFQARLNSVKDTQL